MKDLLQMQLYKKGSAEMFKKVVSILLICLFIFSLVGCKNINNDTDSTKNTIKESENNNESTEQNHIDNTTYMTGTYFIFNEELDSKNSVAMILIENYGPVIINKIDEETAKYNKESLQNGSFVSFNIDIIEETWPANAPNPIYNFEILGTTLPCEWIYDTLIRLDEAGWKVNQDVYKTYITDYIKSEEVILHNPELSNNQFDNLAIILDELDNGENLMFSPLSLNYALALISVGASDDVKKDFENYFGIDYDNYIKFYTNYLNIIEKNTEIANLFCEEESDQIKEEFVNTIKDKFDAKIIVSKFDEDFINEVNTWCAEKTHDMIPSIIDTINPEISTIILNALYFKDSWKEPYEEYQIIKDDFYLSNNTMTTVDYLHSSELNYYENENAVAFAKPYANDRYVFIGILPDKSIIDENYNFKFSDIDLKDLLDNKVDTEVDVEFPKFKSENTLELTNILSKIGLESTMLDDAFPNIINKPLAIDQIIQKTKIIVDETGTEAAAVTEITEKVTSIIVDKEEVILNRPFGYLIYDTTSNIILFAGKIMNPSL